MDFLKLIQEGRTDDFKAKYGQKFSPEIINRIISTVTPKFLQWTGKVLDSINFEDNFFKLTEALKKFEKISSNLPKTDINQYQTLAELTSSITDYENKSRRNVKKVEGGNVVYDDGRFFVVNPLNHEASCYYGKGTKWCTAAETDTHFKKYNDDGKLFYIIDRSKATNDPNYKVALLRKFDGEKLYYDAKDEQIRSGWEIGSEILEKMLSNITGYLQQEFPEQIKIYGDIEAAKKEKQRLERLREQQRVQQLRNDAQERRDDNEWELDNYTSREGLRAHALLKYLVENGDVNVLSNEDLINIQRTKDDIERLNAEYDASEDPRVDLLDEIEVLESELEEYSNYIDVYNIIPSGTYYDTVEFEVIDSPVDGNRYAVGNEKEMQDSAYDYVDNLIDDIGYEGFNSGFAKGFIDTDAVVDYAEDLYNNDVSDSPESYFDEDQRMLSNAQEENIEILRRRISNIETQVTYLEGLMDGENDDQLQDKIDELNEASTEYESEIEEIEENPDGDFPDELIEEKVDSLLSDVRYDPESFISEFGLEWNNFIDKDEFIQGVIDADGYGHTINSYDGSADEVYVNDELFYVMRID
jgi:hypothetical protein